MYLLKSRKDLGERFMTESVCADELIEYFELVYGYLQIMHECFLKNDADSLNTGY